MQKNKEHKTDGRQNELQEEKVNSPIGLNVTRRAFAFQHWIKDAKKMDEKISSLKFFKFLPF